MSKEWKIHPSNGKCVMIPSDHGHLLLFTDSEEDANLIVAAPDLLATLQDIVNMWDHHCYAHGDGLPSPLHIRASAAISKARGQK